MSEESKKIEKIEKDAKQEVKEVNPAELPEQELDKVAGGRAISSPGVGKIESDAATTNRAIGASGVGL
jgi:hypothetical protein